MGKARIIVNGMEALHIIKCLFEYSQWFEFTPLPCDAYEIAVKDDAMQFLARAQQSWKDYRLELSSLVHDPSATKP